VTTIPGFATSEATAALADRFDEIAYAQLGRTGLRCSQAAFGCYRVADGVAMHREALTLALKNGINLIDTSANYADGESEVLVGKVLTDHFRSGTLRREELIVVSKVGYLQGRNYALSQDRKAQGRPFPDLVPYAEGLEHCIHPAFLEDQLTRSLERLNLATLDVYLLHNPEYYLGWAVNQGMDPEAARVEYDRRLETAFRYLEEEVRRRRIRCYGISSNTFPETPDRANFTCFERVLEIADRLKPRHHFHVIQFPMNLFEWGAVRTANQPGGDTLRDAAQKANMGVLVNRPLNAIGDKGLLRLADVKSAAPPSAEDIEAALRILDTSETSLVQAIHDEPEIPATICARIEAQIRIAPALRQGYQDIPSYDAWCQIRDTQILPRVNGVLAYLEQQATAASLSNWIASYQQGLSDALATLTAVHAPAASARAEAIKTIVGEADPDWQGEGTLSQLAIGALRSTAGISSVLVGMRRATYVQDVLQELGRQRARQSRENAWAYLAKKLSNPDLV
jgi:aryl-alcohol dehydrogenase-like predicted oxidoreductase